MPKLSKEEKKKNKENQPQKRERGKNLSQAEVDALWNSILLKGNVTFAEKVAPLKRKLAWTEDLADANAVAEPGASKTIDQLKKRLAWEKSQAKERSKNFLSEIIITK
jgi:hypothetical protein